MRIPSIAIAHVRVRLGVAGAVILMGIVTPVHASSPTPDPIAQAQQALHQAQGQASASDSALAQSQAALAVSQALLASIQQQIAALDADIATKTAKMNEINQELLADRNLLKNYMLQAYMRGRSGTLEYLLSSASLSDALNRQANVQAFTSAGEDLVGRVKQEEQAAADALSAVKDARAKVAIDEAKAGAAEQVLADQEAQVSATDRAAHAQLSAAANTLGGLLLAQQAAAARSHDQGVTFSPVQSSNFTIDTDLTKPSGLTATVIDQFLNGTAMAGLGSAFISAEQAYHVSARYFVAHAILESAWGSSAIAHDKHNLFGYGADDANPYGDAVNFPSFAACINTVAQAVERNYLTPGGAFYHGPTLRGMNVDYASDPEWANKIASIANTIPG